MKTSKQPTLSSALEELAEEAETVVMNEDTAPLEIDDEEAQFYNDEVGKGLEAICALERLAANVEFNTGKGIGIESYQDAAKVAYNSILSSIGLENSSLVFDADDETGADAKKINTGEGFGDKVKAAVQKILEVIKMILQKVTEFFEKVYAAVTDRLSKAKVSLEQLNDTLKKLAIKNTGLPNFDIENPMFFKQKKLLSMDDIFMSFVVPANNNLEAFEALGEMFRTDVLKGFEAFDIANYNEHINSANGEFIKKLKGERSKKYGVHVTSEGYIDAVIEHEDSLSKIKFIKEEIENPVSVQTIALVSVSPSMLDRGIDSFNTIAQNNHQFYSRTKDNIDKTLVSSMEKIQRELKESTGEKQQKLFNQAKNMKTTLDQLTALRSANNKYIADLSGMIHYYSVNVDKYIKSKTA